jgi:hypothetical protein
MGAGDGDAFFSSCALEHQQALTGGAHSSKRCPCVRRSGIVQPCTAENNPSVAIRTLRPLIDIVSRPRSSGTSACTISIQMSIGESKAGIEVLMRPMDGHIWSANRNLVLDDWAFMRNLCETQYALACLTPMIDLLASVSIRAPLNIWRCLRSEW